MGNQTILEELHLAGNDLTGPNLTTLGKLTKSRLLVLDNNQINTLNSIFNTFIDLKVLNMSKQRPNYEDGGLHGKLPTFHNNTLLLEVYLNRNALTGDIS